MMIEILFYPNSSPLFPVIYNQLFQLPFITICPDIPHTHTQTIYIDLEAFDFHHCSIPDRFFIYMGAIIKLGSVFEPHSWF